MDPQIKQLWVDALRSGAYEQGAGYLKSMDGKYCCLGVLCDLAVKAEIIPEPTEHQGPSESYDYGQEGELKYDIVLPNSVVDWAQLEYQSPTVSTDRAKSRLELNGDDLGRYTMQLTEANDSGKYSFNDIAQLIEDYL